jgi:hypothetical protein
MLVTRYFGLLHVPRTGGLFLNDICSKHLPTEWILENPAGEWHVPYSEVAPRLGDLPLLCFVRNPWDWYVSFYHYNRVEMGRRPESWAWKALFDEGDSNFKQTVTRVLWPGRLEPPKGRGPHWYRDLNNSTLDLYSSLHEVVAGRAIEEGRADVGRFERLKQDFLDFLDRHEVPVEEEFKELVRRAPPTNVSARGRYQDYYDDELRDLIGVRVSRLIEDFNYSFEPDSS